jgi:glucosamine--fructose-6-phosphate aminotransferase (isomerizing)
LISVPTIFIVPNGSIKKDIIGNIMEVKTRRAEIITLCEEGDEEVIKLSDEMI